MKAVKKPKVRYGCNMEAAAELSQTQAKGLKRKIDVRLLPPYDVSLG